MRVERVGKARALPLALSLPTPTQVYRPIVCPSCGGERPRVRATSAVIRYYECTCCGLPFKVPVARPEP